MSDESKSSTNTFNDTARGVEIINELDDISICEPASSCSSYSSSPSDVHIDNLSVKSNLQFDTLKYDSASGNNFKENIYRKSSQVENSGNCRSRIIDDTIVSSDKNEIFVNNAKFYFELSLLKLKESKGLLYKNNPKVTASKQNSKQQSIDTPDGKISPNKKKWKVISNYLRSKNRNDVPLECSNTQFDSIVENGIEAQSHTDDYRDLEANAWITRNTVSKETKLVELEMELNKTKKELEIKEKEVKKLTIIRDKIDSEIDELTSNLFQEAHKMVREANEKRASLETSLLEATMKIDGLETEIAGLKSMSLTSTPAQANVDQLQTMSNELNEVTKKRISFNGSLNGSFLNKNLKTGNNKSPMGSISSLSSLNASSIVIGAGGLGNCTTLSSTAQSSEMTGAINTPNDPNADPNDQLSGSPYANGVLVPVGCTPNSGGEMRNVDPNLRQEYLEWKKNPSLDRDSSEFLNRIYKEDIDLCLDFPIDKENQYLKSDLHEAIHKQSICITPLKPEKNEFRKHCPLLNSKNVLCKFHVRLGLKGNSEDRDELFISQLARNRITAVCTFLNYLDYIIKGLVKSHHNDVYWEILQLRKSMVLARFGFSPD